VNFATEAEDPNKCQQTQVSLFKPNLHRYASLICTFKAPSASLRIQVSFFKSPCSSLEVEVSPYNSRPASLSIQVKRWSILRIVHERGGILPRVSPALPCPSLCPLFAELQDPCPRSSCMVDFCGWFGSLSSRGFASASVNYLSSSNAHDFRFV
jgi:hypothetical protein